MDENKYYKVYSTYLKERYKEKVYKLPVSLPCTCPNRDGEVGDGGCTFCGEEGGTFENLESTMSVKEQLNQNMSYIRKRYKANKFIAYFQNFTNTYMEFTKFKEAISEAIMEDIVGISVSTRPDCISDVYLNYLSEIKEKYNVDITIELGLQTVNYHSLKKINRGHGLAEYLDAVLRIKNRGFFVCTHMILNLPWDNVEDVIEAAKIMSALKVDEIKLHSLYIIEQTKIGFQYKNNEFELIDKEEYIERVITFLEYLNPEIAIQRLIGRAPEEGTLFVNWNTSWWKIKDEILEKMEREDRYQGKKNGYLNGRAVKKFEKR